jgi:hypothetical protein
MLLSWNEAAASGRASVSPFPDSRGELKDHLGIKPTACALVLITACLLAITPFFWEGNPSGHDFEFHVYSWMEALGQWKLGIVYPRWAALAHFGYGEPRFIFYPPASWMLGAALGAALPWRTVPGAYCCIVLALAGASMYRLARVWLRAEDALFAAVFYALNPYHLLIVYWRSAYAELLAASLLPLILLFLLRLANGARDSRFSQKPTALVRPMLGLSLILAAAWLINLPAAVMIHYSTAGLALLLAITERSSSKQLARTKTHVFGLPFATAGAILIGIGLASFYLLPAVYEQRWINIDEVFSPIVRPENNFLFTTISDPDHNRFNLLVSIVATAEISVLLLAILALAISQRHRPKSDRSGASAPLERSVARLGATNWTPLAAWGIGSALIMLPISNFLWQHLPKLRFAQLPFRWLLCMNVAVAVLLAMAAKNWMLRLLVCGILLATLVISGHLTQPPWWDTAADIREMSDFMESGTGYEGTDEYVPAGADASELNKDLPLISDRLGMPVHSKMIAWNAADRHFAIESKSPRNIVVRLFSYPAWQVLVNGKSVATDKTETTGLMMIPIAAGENDVRIYFRRTADGSAGIIVSLITIALVILLWITTRRSVGKQNSQPSTAIGLKE